MSHYIWGVDPSTKLMAIGLAAEQAPQISCESFSLPHLGQEGERLQGFVDVIFHQARKLAVTHPPCCIWVEQPGGRVVPPISWYTVGVAMATFFDATRAPTWSVPPGKWKKVVIGNGAADKAKIAQWATAVGVVFDCQDEADAAGVCAYGQQMWAEKKVVRG